jgi:hypothetical protein
MVIMFIYRLKKQTNLLPYLKKVVKPHKTLLHVYSYHTSISLTKKKKKYKKKEKKKGTGKAGGNKFPLHDVVWILWRVMLHM